MTSAIELSVYDIEISSKKKLGKENGDQTVGNKKDFLYKRFLDNFGTTR